MNNNIELLSYDVAKALVASHVPFVKMAVFNRRISAISFAVTLFGVVFVFASFWQGVDLAPIAWYLTGVNTCLAVLNARNVIKRDRDIALAEQALTEAKKVIENHKEA